MQKIWTFKENDTTETDQIDLKTFKPTGKFYEDVELLAKTFNVKVHPALKPVSYAPLPGEEPTKEEE